jgi:hypothetical protein
VSYLKYLASAVCLSFSISAPARADKAEIKPVAVKFELLTTKHMVLQIKINGKGPYRVIFDTGAPVTLINTKTAKESGLITKKTPQPAFSLFGPVVQTNIQKLEIGDLKAESVPVIVMDHPTVKVISEVLGPVEGIVGFPFFARYRMTLDYQAKELTFVPSGFVPTDILQSLLMALMARDKPAPTILAPAALWGFVVDKDKDDETPGVTIKKVLPASAAARAGLQIGDRLLTLDDRWTDSVNDCYTAAGYVRPGTEVKVVVRREGKEKELLVTPQAGL